MSKDIQIIDVTIDDVASGKSTYKVMTVAFKNLAANKVDAKKIMSFAADKGVWEILSKATKGDTFSVDEEKDAKGFWQWTAIHRQDGTPRPAATPTPTKPSYETPEERANRQVLIVRQSSLASAVELCKDHGKQPNPDEVIKVAKQFEAYVFGTGIDALTNDLVD